MLTVQRWVPVFGMLMAAALLPPGAYARQQRAAA